MVKQYEIYWVSLDPTLGSETKKNKALLKYLAQCFKQPFEHGTYCSTYFHH